MKEITITKLVPLKPFVLFYRCQPYLIDWTSRECHIKKYLVVVNENYEIKEAYLLTKFHPNVSNLKRISINLQWRYPFCISNRFIGKVLIKTHDKGRFPKNSVSLSDFEFMLQTWNMDSPHHVLQSKNYRLKRELPVDIYKERYGKPDPSKRR